MLGTAHSIWFVGLCLLLGLAYAMLLYFKSKEQFPLWLKRTAFGCRAAAVALISFLLLRPTVETKVKEVEKPIILIGADNSESIVMGKDSSYYRGKYIANLQQMVQHLSSIFQVETYDIADTLRQGISGSFDGKATRLSLFFQQTFQTFPNRNVGALILLSDGIYTEGTHPLYAAKSWKVPVYTVALGDTTPQKDARIAKINYNKTVYKRNFFPMEILVQAQQLGRKQSKLQVLLEDKVVFEKNITYKEAHSEWVRLNLEAKEAGMLHYHILLDGVEGERTFSNNHAEAVIQVLEERKRIAIVYRAPHPDVAAITAAVKDHPQYEVESFPIEKFHADQKHYNLIVLHQLPNSQQPLQALLETARKAGTSILYFTGNLSNEPANRLPAGLQIQSGKPIQQDAYPEWNLNFNDFNMPNGITGLFAQCPPVQLPFGKYTLPASAKICIHQKINHIHTEYPLLFLQSDEVQKQAVCIGEGWWRWRLYDYLWSGSHEHFDALTDQLFQYLLAKEDKDFFRVKCQNLFTENESVIFDAELYNKNYELVNQPEVSLTLSEIHNPHDKFNYSFSRNFQAYHLEVGRLKAGDYQWKATVQVGKEQYSRSGSFCVTAVQAESLNLTADHQLMQNIAALNNAKMFYPNQLDELEKEIRSNAQIKSVARYTKNRHSLLNNLFLLLLLIGLAGGEWFLRKWSGNY